MEKFNPHAVPLSKKDFVVARIRAVETIPSVAESNLVAPPAVHSSYTSQQVFEPTQRLPYEG